MIVASIALFCTFLAQAPEESADPDADISVLVLSLEPKNQVNDATAELVTAFLTQELRKHAGFKVVGLKEIEGTLSSEERRQIAGCDSASCAAEIAAAMNSQRIVMGTLGTVANNVVINVSMVDARTAKVVGASVRRLRSDNQGAILDEIPSVAAELVTPLADLKKGTIKAPAPRRAGTLRNEVHERFLAFKERTITTSNGKSTTTRQEEVPVMGPYEKELSWVEFYNELGRGDLARSVIIRFIVRIALWVAGGLMIFLGSFAPLMAGLGAAAGAFALILVLFPPTNSSGLAVLLLVPTGAAIGIILVGMAAGYGIAGAAFVTGMLIPGQPVAPDEMRRMADEHNANL